MLSRHGARSLLVERHPGTAFHPKARNIHARTTEAFRQYGVEAAVVASGLPTEQTRSIIWAESLAGEEIDRRVTSGAAGREAELSPSRQCFCSQDVLEAVLRAYAEGLGPGGLRFGTELTEFEQDAAGVSARLVERESGAEVAVCAAYLVAADGASGRVRGALGIPLHGREAVYERVNILPRADLTRWTAGRPAALYFVDNPAVLGTFLTINARDRWGFLVNDLARGGRRWAGRGR